VTRPPGRDDLKNVVETQGLSGNWDWSPYMLGLYNGLELALSILENGRDPVFRSKPPGGYREANSRVVITPALAGTEFDPVRDGNT
jgi:hypothetical protein